MDSISASACSRPASGVEKNAHRLAESLKRVAEGDRQAFEDVYRLTAAKLFGVCMKILVDLPRAEDALQSVYITVWRRAASFDERRGSAMTWLITIARNRAVDELRRSKEGLFVSVAHAIDVPDSRPLASDMIEAGSTHHVMRSCLDRLSVRDAAALKAAFLEGATYADLAVSAAVPVATMKSGIRRALLRLRSFMVDAEREVTTC